MAHMIDMSDIENVGTNRNRARKDGGGLQNQQTLKQTSQRSALVSLVNQSTVPNFRVQPSRAAKQHGRLQQTASHHQPSMTISTTISTTTAGNSSIFGRNNKSTTSTATRSAVTRGQFARQQQQKSIAVTAKSTFQIYEDLTPDVPKKAIHSGQSASGKSKGSMSKYNSNNHNINIHNNNNNNVDEDMEVTFERSANFQVNIFTNGTSINSTINSSSSSGCHSSSSCQPSAFGAATAANVFQNNLSIAVTCRNRVEDDDDEDDDGFDVDDVDPSSYSDLDISLDSSHQQSRSSKFHRYIPGSAARYSLLSQTMVDVYSLPEYRDEIFSYVRESELRYMPRPDYMKKQTDITHSMRTILVDWLVEVADEYKLKRETFFLAVNYIDRFLSVMSVIRCRLQLLGAAAMFIAAKYEEIYPPDVGEFVYITDDTYTMKQVLQMEQAILKSLNFLVAAPTPNYFCCDLLDRLGAYKKGQNGACDDGGRWNSLAMFMLELTSVNGEEFLKYSPSVIATSCVVLSYYLINKTGCMTQLTRLTSYSIYDLSDCLDAIFKTLHNCPLYPQQAVRSKYISEKFHFVANLTLPKSLTLDVL